MVDSAPRSANLETESAGHTLAIDVNPCQKGKKRETPKSWLSAVVC